MLSVSLDYQFLIAPLIFSSVYMLCYCLYSSCVPYVLSFSGLSIFDCTFSILERVYVFVLFVFALCTLCCQFLLIAPSVFSNVNMLCLCLYSSCVTFVVGFTELPFLIAPSVFSNVYMLWFCFSSSCVLYVDSFSGLSIFDCPFGIL